MSHPYKAERFEDLIKFRLIWVGLAQDNFSKICEKLGFPFKFCFFCLFSCLQSGFCKQSSLKFLTFLLQANHWLLIGWNGELWGRRGKNFHRKSFVNISFAASPGNAPQQTKQISDSFSLPPETSFIFCYPKVFTSHSSPGTHRKKSGKCGLSCLRMNSIMCTAFHG